MNRLVTCLQPLNIRLVGILVLSLLLGGVATVMAQGTASTPESEGGITPYIIEGGSPGGNRTCAEVGTAFFGDPDYYQCSSARVNYDPDTNSFDNMFEDVTGDPECENNISVTVTDDTYVAWTSTNGIGAAIVKGSNDANVYVYEPQETSDSGLASPPNASGNLAGLSNLTFCWNPKDEEQPAQWCSPGYWKNHPDEADFAAGQCEPALDMDETTYSSQFGAPQLSPQGERQGAPTDPTLREVLDNPQWYGGGAANNVGDLLSECHPNVNFTGERVEDSCPLD